MNCIGIGRKPGQSARSHASVHSVRSWRAGLPLNARERTVCDDGAASIFSTTSGDMSLSAHGQPDRSGPRALRAHRERRRDLRAVADPARREHRRVGAIASITSGHSTIELISPVWPPASVPCATMMSTPMFTCFCACCDVARERGDLDAVLVRGVDDVLGRRAERVHEQRRRVLQRDVELRARGRVGPAEQVMAALDVVGQRRHVVLGEHLLDPVAVLLGDHRLELALEVRGVDALGQLHLGRHHEVDAVGLAVDVLVDPRRARSRARRA